MGINKLQKKQLEFELISNEARLKLTRLIRCLCQHSDHKTVIGYMNRYINIANNVLKRPIYTLDADVYDEYFQTEFNWHYSELELIMRRPSTSELLETIGDYLQNKLIQLDEVNNILKDDSLSVSFKQRGKKVLLEIVPIDKIDMIQDTEEHPNIRKLVNRMVISHENKDYPNVLHASGSIFETLAKSIVRNEEVQNKSLGQFFAEYVKESALPQDILTYIRSVFRRRNTEPNAGHGNTTLPTISEEDSLILIELTQSIVRIERQLQRISLDNAERRTRKS
ncbi:hypothetical protein [Bacillus altitudinis]|uniref:hypothetical protein n=1 Tax=Bacillus altitudinis TaxID=293387 RepID=UPI0037C72D0D